MALHRLSPFGGWLLVAVLVLWFESLAKLGLSTADFSRVDHSVVEPENHIVSPWSRFWSVWLSAGPCISVKIVEENANFLATCRDFGTLFGVVMVLRVC